MSEVVTGTIAFSNVTEHDVFNGVSTGKYNVTVVLDEVSESKLNDLGVRIKDYEGKPQRKFTSKFPFEVIGPDDEPFPGEIPHGSKVKVLTEIKGDHPQWGPACYISKIRVVERANSQDVPEDF